MLKFWKFRCWGKRLVGIIKPDINKSLVQWIILTVLVSACESDPYGSNWVNEDSFSISQYLDKNRDEYSKFYKLMAEGKMLNTLYAYNPYGNDYTLFLPANEAIDQFIQQNQSYGNFEELVTDTGFIKILTRYHTLNEKLHTDEFPDGALNDTTLTGDRLVTSFFSNGDNQLIKVNNSASVIKSNLKMSNGYIHVISGVLQKTEVSGYDWLQQQDEYSILAEAVRLSGFRNRLWWNKYTILAEHDSIYHRNGIYNIEDLITRIATPGMSLSNRNNTFHQFAAYHFVGGEFYTNDLHWDSSKYTTLASKPLTINVGVEIKINPGIDTYGYKISESGDTLLIDYILPIWERCNIMASTGPVHSISDMLFYEPLPENK
jgi:uncharacterized surface protein with fasciclin (FAS1) repeats